MVSTSSQTIVGTKGTKVYAKINKQLRKISQTKVKQGGFGEYSAP